MGKGIRYTDEFKQEAVLRILAFNVCIWTFKIRRLTPAKALKFYPYLLHQSNEKMTLPTADPGITRGFAMHSATRRVASSP